MKKWISRIILSAAVTMLSLSIANAAAPVQFSFFDFNAPKDSEVKGVRFPAIYGKGGGNITGVEVNLLAYSEMESFTGLNFPLFGLGGNRITGEMTGVSFGGILNWHEGQDTGVNVGAVNITNNVKGLNLGLLNKADGHTIADVGMVNISKSSNFQLSWVNVTEEIKGVQLGLVNCAKNGFLPCFIFINFAPGK